MFISFTLTPALCATFLCRPRDLSHHAKSSKSRGVYAAVDSGYGHLLRGLWATASSWWRSRSPSRPRPCISPKVGKELVPDDDQSEFSVNVRLPRGTSFPRTREYVATMEADLRNLGPEVQMILANINPGGANFYIALTPLESRNVSFLEVWGARIKSWVSGTPYQGRASVSQQGDDTAGAHRCSATRTETQSAVSSGGAKDDVPGRRALGPRQPGGGSSNRVNVFIQGPDIEQLQIYVADLMARWKRFPAWWMLTPTSNRPSRSCA